MKLFILAFAIFVLFIIMDLLWFKVAGGFFKGEIGSIARISENGNWDVLYVPALLVYALMAVGIVAFVLPLATTAPHALALGALFGLVGYGLYDLTNLATLSAWTIKFSIVDMTWGTLLCGVVSLITHQISRFVSFV